MWIVLVQFKVLSAGLLHHKGKWKKTAWQRILCLENDNITYLIYFINLILNPLPCRPSDCFGPLKAMLLVFVFSRHRGS